MGAGIKRDVKFALKLKENWKPKVDHVARGEFAKVFFSGTDLNALIESETLVLDGKCVDADARVGSGKEELCLRLVGVYTPKSCCFFLTRWPSSIGPAQVSDIYRIRWEADVSHSRCCPPDLQIYVGARPPRPLVASGARERQGRVRVPPRLRRLSYGQEARQFLRVSTDRPRTARQLLDPAPL